MVTQGKHVDALNRILIHPSRFALVTKNTYQQVFLYLREILELCCLCEVIQLGIDFHEKKASKS